MEVFKKINAIQLMLFWRNFAVSLLVYVATMAFTMMLPQFMAPVVSLVCAGFLYSLLYTSRVNNNSSCMIIVYVFFLSLIAYTFLVIGINVLSLLNVAKGFMAFIIIDENPFIPTLLMLPVGLITLLWIYYSRRDIALCLECKMSRGDMYLRGKLGFILNQEVKVQMKNLMVLFAVLSVIMWTYYLVFYVNVNINSRDRYIFLWLAIICFMIDEVYFLFRYYNLYMDLRERDEVLTQDEIDNLSNHTYLRVYIICGNSIYVKEMDSYEGDNRRVLDTVIFESLPTFQVNSRDDVKKYVEKRLGVKNGELKFFFSQKNRDLNSKQRIDRYFYFIDGKPENAPKLALEGKWLDYDFIKELYIRTPMKLPSISVSDTTRLATIILTEKMFDENGHRKVKLKSYHPTFSLYDVRKSTLDFQDNKWIRVSMLNSDVKFFRLRRLWHSLFNSKSLYNKTH